MGELFIDHMISSPNEVSKNTNIVQKVRCMTQLAATYVHHFYSASA